MNELFADRISDVPRSFIREILKIRLDPHVISFAGGLPNRDLFPTQELIESTSDVFEKFGNSIFQYSNSEGYIELRNYIAARYQKDGLNVSPENILITSGAQQGLDLLGFECRALTARSNECIWFSIGSRIDSTTITSDMVSTHVSIFAAAILLARVSSFRSALINTFLSQNRSFYP